MIPGAQLVLRSTQGAVLRQAYTAADGSAVVGGLPAGSYWLDVTATHFGVRRVGLNLGVDRRTTAPGRAQCWGNRA